MVIEIVIPDKHLSKQMLIEVFDRGFDGQQILSEHFYVAERNVRVETQLSNVATTRILEFTKHSL